MAKESQFAEMVQTQPGEVCWSQAGFKGGTAMGIKSIKFIVLNTSISLTTGLVIPFLMSLKKTLLFLRDMNHS